MNRLKSINSDKYINILLWLIVVAGIAIRIAVYFQNRNLIIDEANIARNIYERDFAGLLQPLNYQQYAPPVFLWIVKLGSVLFGFSEYALRSYALVSGIATIFLLYAILKKTCSLSSIWYPVYLFASAAVFIRFSSEVKQYMPDAMIASALLLLALRTDIHKKTSAQFAFIWMILGSIAVWASMPSVFTLSAVFVYYAVVCHKNKTYNKLAPLLAAAAVWLTQFAVYYFIILKPQVQSSYLQNYHQHDFIITFPQSAAEWSQNGEILLQLIGRPGGFTAMAVGFNLLLLIVGIISFLRRDRAKALLFIVPVIALIIASAMHQYSMASRLILFVMVPVLILVGRGFSTVMQLNVLPVKIIAVLAAVLCAWNNKILDQLSNDSERENLTASLEFARHNYIQSGGQLYVHSGAVPNFIYYARIHPSKEKWAMYKDAHLLEWEANYDSLAVQLSGRNTFVLTSAVPGEIGRVKDILCKQKQIETQMDITGGHVIIIK